MLALHGKPVRKAMSYQEQVTVLTRGFRFYGYLYLCLGIVMSVGLFASLLHEAVPFGYWSMLLGFASIYLIGSSQLAFRGARLFQLGNVHGAVLLIVFFASIVVFLGAFGAALSVWAYYRQYLTNTLNVVMFVGFILFGVGSYFIELSYLAWWSGRSPADDGADKHIQPTH